MFCHVNLLTYICTLSCPGNTASLFLWNYQCFYVTREKIHVKFSPILVTARLYSVLMPDCKSPQYIIDPKSKITNERLCYEQYI